MNPRHHVSMNPHSAVRPLKVREEDFKEILQDFDAHCHERLSLSATAWRTTVPVHLLAPAEQIEFESTRWENADEAVYKGARRFTDSAKSTSTITTLWLWSTRRKGVVDYEGFWFAFTLENGQWKQQHWPSIQMIS